MLSAFCFSRPGTNIEILKVTEDDFCYHLMEYCRKNGITTIAMDLETRYSAKYGVMDMLAKGFKIVVVHPNYSPICDKRVLPLCVHRDIKTLSQHFHDVICIGNLVIQLFRNRLLADITVIEEEGEIIRSLPVDTANGWKIISTKENELGLSLTKYHYSSMEIL